MSCVRRALSWLVCALVGLVGPLRTPGAEPAGPAAAEADLRARARQIHDRVLTLDSHVDIAGPQYATPQLDPGIDHPELQCDLVKMAAGGIDGVFLAAYVPQQARDPDGYSRAYQTVIEKISAIRRLATMYPDRCELATTPDEVERIAARDKRAIMLGIENGYAIGMDLANVQRFHDLGVRYITLSHNGHNQICDSCNPARKLGDGEAEHHGLSPFGRQVVAEMNRLGILIDVSHVAPSSLRDAVALSQAPVIASHSGCSAVFEHPRNLSDEQLRMLQAHGGVIQVVAVAGFLKRKASEKDKPDSRDPSASVQDFVDHIDHAVRVAGVEHVGLGSDFDGGGGIRGFQNHAEALNVTIELVRRGYTEDAIAKIWGANLLRVWREAQATAMRLNDKRP